MTSIKRPGQSAREESLYKYFARPQSPPNAPGIILICLGAIIFPLSLNSLLSKDGSDSLTSTLTLMFLIFGVASVASGGFLLSENRKRYQRALEEAQPKPPDQQVQKWLDEGFKNVILHSRIILNLNEDEGTFSEPLIIISPILTRARGLNSDWTLWQKGDDGVLRFGCYHFIVIRLTDRHLGSYQCDYDFIRDVALNERTSEIHFCDLVSVATEEWSDPGNLPTGQKLTTRQDFVLSVASGEAIRVSVDTAQIRRITGVEKPPELGAESAVAQIRAMLRSYKALSAAA